LIIDKLQQHHQKPNKANIHLDIPHKINYNYYDNTPRKGDFP
jgi:hypothetical protein